MPLIAHATAGEEKEEKGQRKAERGKRKAERGKRKLKKVLSVKKHGSVY